MTRAGGRSGGARVPSTPAELVLPAARFSLGFIPQGARERALQHKTQMYQREGRLSLFAAPNESGFTTPPLGSNLGVVFYRPQPTSSLFFPPFTSGRVTALAVNPSNSNNVFLGGADGGLWVTTDGGNTWNPLTDNPPNSAKHSDGRCGAIAVDPTTVRGRAEWNLYDGLCGNR